MTVFTESSHRGSPTGQSLASKPEVPIVHDTKQTMLRFASQRHQPTGIVLSV